MATRSARHRLFTGAGGIVVASLLVAFSPAAADEPPRDERAATKVGDLDVWGSVSPSGRWLAFVDWSSGNLILRDLTNGAEAKLTDKGTWMESGEFGMFPVFSQDGQWLAYSWFNSDGFWDLRLLGVGGGEPKVLFADSEHPYVQPHAFSPDGRAVLATIDDGPLANRMALVDVDDGGVRKLASLDWRVPSTACFLGSGERIVYDRLVTAEATRRGLFVRPTEGGAEMPLLEEEADHLLMGCAPRDGGPLFFASDRAGSWDVWRLEFDDEGNHGEPERWVADVGPLLRGLGVTRRGDLYYGLSRGRADVYVTSIEPAESGAYRLEKVAGPVAFNSQAAWSRDGSRLAYVLQHGSVRTGLVYSFDFALRSMKSGEERLSPLRMTTFGGHAFTLDWAGDDSYVLAQGRDHTGREGYFRIDVDSGTAEPAMAAGRCPPSCLEWPSLAADGILYFTRWTESGQRLVQRDLASGEERTIMPIVAPEAIGPLSVSPDGEWLGVLWKDMAERSLSIRALAPARRTGRDLVVVAPPLWVTAIDWTSDSRHLLYTTIDADRRTELWQVPLDFGEPERLGTLADGLLVNSLRASPDGEHLALSAGTARRSEVWVVPADDSGSRGG